MCTNNWQTSWHKVEGAIFQWAIQPYENGYVMLRNVIWIQSLTRAKENVNYAVNFKAVNSWCNRFVAQKSLSLCPKTKIAQKLQKDKKKTWKKMEGKKHKFLKSCNSVAEKTQLPSDETQVNLNMPSNRTVNVKGEKTILIKTTGNEKKDIQCCIGMHG